MLIFGTGPRMARVPESVRGYVKALGIQMDVMDTVRVRGVVLTCF